MDDGWSWGEMWWSKEDFIRRFSAHMNGCVGDDFDYTECAEATWGVIEDYGHEDMTREEWADAELDAWRDSC